MIKGTNAEFGFNIPYPYSELSDIKILFWQPENKGPSPDRSLPITKSFLQCFSRSEKQFSTILDCEETDRFSDKRKAYVEMRATTKSGISFGSKPRAITVYTSNIGFSPTQALEEYITFDGADISSESSDEIVIVDARNI